MDQSYQSIYKKEEMTIRAHIKPFTLNFARPAGTSRGVYQTRKSWFIILRSDDCVGIGECAPLPKLSCDDLVNYEEILTSFCKRINDGKGINFEDMREYPSILFGFETALQHLHSSNSLLWDSPFARGESGITINGLIWMGTQEYMLQQIDAKVEMGFKCLKLKVGAIDFEHELSLVSHIRERYSEADLEIRLDANGGFKPADALTRLAAFARYGIHSIEQPIMARQVGEMAALVKSSPIPIALDEELIGVNRYDQKQMLLEEIHPHYIILKPSLHGGLLGASEWIELAKQHSIGWWITSALESNVGLNAIAQWCASLNVTMPQGLGTGMLFTNNISSPLHIDKQELWYGSQQKWDWQPLLED